MAKNFKWEKAFLCEKDSQVQALCSILGAKYEGRFKPAFNHEEKIVIIPLKGHVLKGLEPHEYDPKYGQFTEEAIFVFPEKYKYKPEPKEKRLLDTAVNLLKESKHIYIATDYDKEGAAIALNVIDYAKIPHSRIVKMLEMGSAHPKELKRTIESPENTIDYKSLAAAGRTRAFIDWAEGMSLSRALSYYLGNKYKVKLNFGGVKSPIVYLVVMRYLENKNHKKSYYYVATGYIVFDGKKIPVTLKKVEENEEGKIQKTEKFNSKKELENAIQLFLNKKNVKIKNLTRSFKQQEPPKLYELTSLQADLGSILKVKASEIMNIAQYLYDFPVAIQTYPRTEIPYLKEAEYEDVPKILKKLKEFEIVKPKIIENILSSEIPKRKTVFNNKEVTAHGAIVPTLEGELDKWLPKLTSKQKKVFEEVAKRYVAAFAPNYEYQTVKGETEILEEKYFLEFSEHIPLKAGWKEIFEPDIVNKIKNYQKIVPENLKKNCEVEVESLKIEEKETKPKPLFTQKTLLRALRYISSLFPDNEEIKKYLGEHGLGTPATRSDILDHLMDPNKNKGEPWLKIENGKILPTEKAIKFIGIIPEKIVSPLKRALLSKYINKIESGELDSDKVVDFYRDEVKKMIEIIYQTYKEKGAIMGEFSHEKKKQKVLGKCPKCKEGEIVEKGKTFGCTNAKWSKDDNGNFTNEGCDYQIFKGSLSRFGKKTITSKEVEKLLKNGKVEVELISKTGKPYKADMIIDLQWGVKVDFSKFQK